MGTLVKPVVGDYHFARVGVEVSRGRGSDTTAERILRAVIHVDVMRAAAGDQAGCGRVMRFHRSGIV